MQLVYNFTSFTLASMMACTVFFWLRLGSIAEQVCDMYTINAPHIYLDIQEVCACVLTRTCAYAYTGIRLARVNRCFFYTHP